METLPSPRPQHPQSPEQRPPTPTEVAKANRGRWNSTLYMRITLGFGILSTGLDAFNSLAAGDPKRAIVSGTIAGLAVMSVALNEATDRLEKKKSSK